MILLLPAVPRAQDMHGEGQRDARVDAHPPAMEAEREWGQKSGRITLLAGQTRVSGIEGSSMLTQGLLYRGTICPRIMEPGIKKQTLGLQLESVMGGA